MPSERPRKYFVQGFTLDRQAFQNRGLRKYLRATPRTTLDGRLTCAWLLFCIRTIIVLLQTVYTSSSPRIPSYLRDASRQSLTSFIAKIVLDALLRNSTISEASLPGTCCTPSIRDTHRSTLLRRTSIALVQMSSPWPPETGCLDSANRAAWAVPAPAPLVSELRPVLLPWSLGLGSWAVAVQLVFGHNPLVALDAHELLLPVPHQWGQATSRAVPVRGVQPCRASPPETWECRSSSGARARTSG